MATATASSSATSRSLPTRCASSLQLGAEVLVNISDDGWYGDTSAPWQHLNMARMRAIENRRWLLRDTNTGVTAAIDPYGRVRQSIPRHQTDALPAEYSFRSDVTFYTAHGECR
jgi:apolipoprotein N-acyltransferase